MLSVSAIFYCNIHHIIIISIMKQRLHNIHVQANMGRRGFFHYWFTRFNIIEVNTALNILVP